MSKQYSLESDLDDMEYEYEKLNRQKKIQNSIVLQQNLLISGISFIEMMNDKYDPFGLRLKVGLKMYMIILTNLMECLKNYTINIKQVLKHHLKLNLLVC